MITLWELFMDASEKSTRLKWRIEDRYSRKVLCKDYGSLKADDCELDNMKVYKYSIREHKYLGRYVRVVVY